MTTILVILKPLNIIVQAKIDDLGIERHVLSYEILK